MNNVVYYIDNIEDYGYFIAFCIDKDVSVWRAYYDTKTPKCFKIDWKEKRLYYSSVDFYKEDGYKVVRPKFIINEYGGIELQRGAEYIACEEVNKNETDD